MNMALERRTAALRAHDCDRWQAWAYVGPFDLWPASAIRSLLDATGWEGAIDQAEPTAAELRALIVAALGQQCAAFEPTGNGDTDHDD